jgi:hypothetical protein
VDTDQRLSLFRERSDWEGRSGELLRVGGRETKKKAAPTRRGPTEYLPLVLFFGFRFGRLAST